MRTGRPNRATRSSVDMRGASTAARLTFRLKKRHSHQGTNWRVWCGYFRSSCVSISQKMPRRPSGVLPPVSCPCERRMRAVLPV